MNLIVYPDRGALAQGVAAAMAGQLAGALALDGRATLCLAGGTTPAPAFDILRHAHLDWSQVTVLPTDERWVNEDDPRSNAALLRRHLLVGPAAAARYVSLYRSEQAAGQAAPALAGDVAAHLPITVLLAGMGTDGHTASLFPDAPEIAAAMADDAPAVMAMTPPTQPEMRMTLTASVLRGARHSHVMITGQDKRDLLERIATGKGGDLPIALLLAKAQIHWAE